MKKGEASSRQIETAKDEIDRKISAARTDWRDKHPRPSYIAEEEWDRKHLSPFRVHSAAEKKAMQGLVNKRESLLFDARMGKITADELYAKVKAF
jgi:hypothetical protein